MNELIGIGVILLCLAIWLIYKRFQRQHWQQLAEGLGLSWKKDSSTVAGLIYGNRAQYTVAIFGDVGRGKGDCIVVKTYLPSGFPETFTIEPRHILGSLHDRFSIKRIETGEEAFDHAYDVRGDADEALQILTHDVRDTLIRHQWAGEMLTLKKGVLLFTIPNSKDNVKALSEALDVQRELVDIIARQWFQGAQKVEAESMAQKAYS